ncbi:TIR domain-containing protein, partial [Chloroflexota bacterium]
VSCTDYSGRGCGAAISSPPIDRFLIRSQQHTNRILDIGGITPIPDNYEETLQGDNVFFAYALKRKSLVLDLARHIEKQHSLMTVLMDEETYSGRSLAEKFEDITAQCGFGIFVLTADDDCVVETPQGENRVKRARQNVVLELGYFWGRLGRKKKIAVLVEDSVEIPSDLLGLGTITITPDLGETKRKLNQEILDARITR